MFSFLLLSLYVGIIMWAKPSDKVSQHQWQDNLIKAQDFIYDTGKVSENIIVGSSLSCRFVMDSLNDFRNLAFNGQSVFEGMNILGQSEKLPKNVFIEMNVIVRGENRGFTGVLFNPLVYWMRKTFPPLRDGNQPLARAGQPVSFAVRGLIKELKSHLVFKKAEAKVSLASTVTVMGGFRKADPVQKNDLLTRLVNMQVKNYSTVADPKLLENRLDELDRYIAPLKKRGINIIFFEMPVNSKLPNLPGAVAIRESFHRRFPANEYRYILQPDCSSYETSDGLHLDDLEAVRYTVYFRDQAGKR